VDCNVVALFLFALFRLLIDINLFVDCPLWLKMAFESKRIHCLPSCFVMSAEAMLDTSMEVPEVSISD
jgi:hypothetical protein